MHTTRLQDLAISDSGFIFDPVTGNSYTSNKTAVYIINRLKTGDDVLSIAKTLTEEYDVKRDEAEQDILHLKELLRGNNLL
jgi:hypothetical protein